jgi:hypothetical protein
MAINPLIRAMACWGKPPAWLPIYDQTSSICSTAPYMMFILVDVIAVLGYLFPEDIL